VKRTQDAGQEDGQVMVLIIGYVLLTLLLVTVVAAVSSVYLAQKRLLSIADGAALAAADSYTLQQVSSAAGAPGTVLTREQVRAAVAAYLQRNDAVSDLRGVGIDAGTGTMDGRSAQVSLSAVAHPLFLNFLVPDGIAVTATSTARSELKR
jgi:Putative Flp pilus-assembly TadE/G-like